MTVVYLPTIELIYQLNGQVLNSIWQQCITCLEGEISEQQLNTWILPLQAEQELNTLKLLAPNRFVMDWVRKHFLERINELVTNLDDSKSISVNLSIGSQTRTTTQIPAGKRHQNKLPGFFHLGCLKNPR